MRAIVAGAVVLFVVAAGCGGYEGSARTQFATSTSCAPEKITVTKKAGDPLPPSAPPADVAGDPGKLAIWKRDDQERREAAAQPVYVVDGCGQEKRYTCAQDKKHTTELVCTELAAGAGPSLTTQPDDADMKRCAPAPARPKEPAAERAGKDAKHCTLGSESGCTSACNDHDAESCAILGKMYGEGIGVEMSYAKSTDMLTLACGSGSARGCHGLGVVHDFGHGISPDPAGAVPFYEQGCDWGYGESCANLAGHYMAGSGVKKDADKAFSYAVRGCAWGSAAGCKRLGALYLAGIGTKKNESCAAVTFRSACAGGDAAACDLAKKTAPSD